ncbi:MAG TPA: hypothetical protein VHD15_12375, partial [Hyphomicrobiales bacterium]|nr:hypothetical protein [Hyphomicrobiales bacterium]
AAPPPAAAATPPADRALAFAPEPAAPTNPALIATVHAVPVFAPDAAKVPAASAPSPLPAPRPMALAEPAAPAPAPAAAAPAPAAPQSNPGALVREARRLIAKGQLAEGRDLLKRAAAAGDSHAATILAKTYDPRVLKVWHVKGAAVDPAEARRWYEKAQELGSPAAKAALEGVH